MSTGRSREEEAVESGVKYCKVNFLPTRSFRDLGDLNASPRRWVTEEAVVRIHGVTREEPAEISTVETPLMQALPAVVALCFKSARAARITADLTLTGPGADAVRSAAKLAPLKQDSCGKHRWSRGGASALHRIKEIGGFDY